MHRPLRPCRRDDRELPLILGLMPVLPKHAINVATFEETTLAKPIGSGPYVVSRRSIPARASRFKRDPELLGQRSADQSRPVEFRRDLRIDYYRDANSYFEAFKAGLYDVRTETRSEPLADGYDIPGRARRAHCQGNLHGRPAESRLRTSCSTRGGQIFADIRVRAGDRRCCSISSGSTTIFSSISISAARAFSMVPNSRPIIGRPTHASAHCLAPFPDAVRPDVLDGTWSPPVTDGSGRDRATLRQALALLQCGGLRRCRAPTLRDRATGQPLSFEIMVTNRDDERLALAFRAQSQARRYRRQGARWSTPCNIEQRRLIIRFRHDRVSLGAVAFARQRAELLLGLGCGRSARHAATTWA